MHVTAIQLSGFKSFAESTILPIADGLTVIVGPNGCGKSNVVEAVRWVMGESSARRLRGEGMDDVIFAGAGKRPRRRSASVSLHLDNSQGLAPAPFHDAPELVVSRTIERNAGSIYRINAQEVRARDVQLLFADLSIGSRSASIISQGEIADLVDTKPEARRLLVEEAAGIRGLQTRRHEAELKLAQAETNLERLVDILQQAEASVLNLERQARTTEKFRAWHAEQRLYEALDWYLQDQQIATELIDFETHIDHAQREFDEASTAQAAETRRQAELAQRIVEARLADEQRLLALQIAQETGHEAKRAWEQVQLKREAAAERAEDWQAELARERKQQQLAQDHLTALMSETDTAAQPQERTQSQELALLRQSLSSTEQRLSQARTLLDSHYQSRHAFREQQQELDAQWKAMKRQRAILRHQQQSLRNPEPPVAVQNETKPESKSRAEDQNEDQNMEAQLAARETEIAGTREQAAQALEKTRQAEEHWQQQRQERETLDQAEQAWRTAEQENQQALKQYQHLALAWQQQQQAKNANQRLVDVWAIPPRWQKIICAALGSHLKSSLNPEAPLYQGPAAQFPQAEWPNGVTPLDQALRDDEVELPGPWPQVLSARLKSIGLCTQIAPLMAALKPGQMLVDTEGNVGYWHGLRTSDQAVQDDHGRETALRFDVLELEKRLPALQQTARVAEQEYQRAQQHWQRQTETAEAAYRQAEQQRKDTSAALASLEQDKREWEDRYRAMLVAWQEYRSQTQAVQQTRKQLKAQQSALQSSYNALQQQRHQLEQRIAAADIATHIARAEQRYATDKQAVDQAKTALMSHQATQAALARSMQRQAAERERLEHSLATHLRRVEELEQRLDAWQAAQPEQQQELVRRQTVLEQSVLVKQDCESQRQQSAAHLQQLLAEEAEHTRLVHAADMRLATRRENLARAQTGLEVKRQQRQSLHQAAVSALSSTIQGDIGDPFAHDLSTLPEQIDFTPTQLGLSLDQVRAERAKLRQQIASLGEVNLRADIDAAEQRESVEKLRCERDDIVTAIAELRQAIATLNAQGRARLKHSFNHMNRLFSEYFHRLFSGGEAQLEWLDGDDPIAPGIDIRARPPGKARQSVHLLSGGEKALTALALIAAVMQLTPTPICLLDEVDAALDDANVERFCQLLLQMTEQGLHTRFVVISHHRLSMARADRLLGVGMPERGVSRLYAVDLRNTERLLSA